MRPLIFLFGEAERGEFCTPIPLRTLPELESKLGNPPEGTDGIRLAIQALLFERELLFFRVKEEGFSLPDYQKGIKLLKRSRSKTIHELSAICIPGVGDVELIETLQPICQTYKSLLILTEKDLYDYLLSPPVKEKEKS